MKINCGHHPHIGAEESFSEVFAGTELAEPILSSGLNYLFSVSNGTLP